MIILAAILILVGFIMSNITSSMPIMLIGNAILSLGVGLCNTDSFFLLLGIGIIISGVINIGLIKTIYTFFGEYEINSSNRIVGIIELVVGFILAMKFA